MPDEALRAGAVGDSALIARAAEGDERAIGPLYERYGGVLYAVAYRIVGQRADAEEVVVEAFAQAWREAARFEAGRGSVAGWLTTIARSRALDLVRARSRRDRITASAAADRPERSPAMGEFPLDPAGALDLDERARQVRRALESLSPPQRQVIELAYFEGLSQSEIAERLQEPLGTVKTRVRLGMQKLRESLRPFYFERGR
ncbi:MAG TPA: sigma-70 family RNA polymerase sigma factor [Gemmatimonadales bacterium]|nr:sigma-70 family RNA polymerase sigma factor [Gemmatimonadales bacterium]